MKKFFYLFAFLTLVMFTSCNSDDDYESKQSFTAVLNNRAVNGTDVMFSQSNATIELNYNNSTIQITSDFKDVDGQTYKINTPAMPMSIAATGIYAFSSSSVSGNADISGINGFIDLNNYTMWYTLGTNGGSSVYTTTHLYYTNTTTVITNVDGNTYSHPQSGYLFSIDSKGETGIFQIGNFIPDTNGSVQATVIQFDGITVTPTTTGYIFTAEEAESSSHKGIYTITNLNIIVDNQGQHMSGSFKVGNHTFTVDGKTWGN